MLVVPVPVEDSPSVRCLYVDDNRDGCLYHRTNSPDRLSEQYQSLHYVSQITFTLTKLKILGKTSFVLLVEMIHFTVER